MNQPDAFYTGEDSRTLALGPVIAEGAEGSLHEIPGDPGRLAKVYHALGEGTRDKLLHMVKIPTEFPPEAGVAWPRALLWDAAGAIRGYTMDTFRGMWPLFYAYNASERRELPIRLTFYDLARAALNISHVVQELHAQGVVVGALSDSNVMVGPGGRIALVDATSFQLEGASAGSLFPCEAMRSVDDAPEAPDKGWRTPQMDNWALAILIFKLLLEGDAPLTPTEAHEELVGIPEEYSDDPATLPLLRNLTPELRGAFRRTFEEGCNFPEQRTTAEEWTSLLEAYCRRLHDGCPVNPEHYFVGDSCLWCAPSSDGEEDHFPSTAPRDAPTDSGPLPMTQTRRRGIVTVLALGFVAAWYVAARLGVSGEALSSYQVLPVPPPRDMDRTAETKPRAQATRSDPQLSCGSLSISIPRADKAMPWPCPAGMVGVPGGPFVAGCTARDCGTDPVCALREVDPFCIAETETTVHEYERCVEDDRSDDPGRSCEEPADEDSSTYAAELARRPVNMLSRHDAAKYCAWLSTTRAFKGWTTRLPTSDEWEKAARGVAGSPYAWGGDQRPGAANLHGNDDALYTANVGKFAADSSPYGALDMIGNVAEWVSDSKGGRAVIKGGSFASTLEGARAWTTRELAADGYASDVGFRCVAVSGATAPVP